MKSGTEGIILWGGPRHGQKFVVSAEIQSIEIPVLADPEVGSHDESL